MTISLDDLASEITKAVREYTNDITEAIEKEVDDTSKEALKEIKANSPRDKGDYVKGWTRKKDGQGGQIKYTIHNKSRGSIVHLLEKGHAKRGGGRVAGKPHVGPAEQKAVTRVVSNIKSIIRNGG